MLPTRNRKAKRQGKSNNSYGKYLAAELKQGKGQSTHALDCVENKEWYQVDLD